MEDFKIPLLPTSGPTKPIKDQEQKNNETSEYAEEKVYNNSQTSATDSTTASVPTCPYKLPSWSQLPSDSICYSFEVLKSGQIIDEIKDLQKQAVWKFGRLPPPANDLELAHPTISRFHAVLQYRPKNSTDQSDNETDDDKSKDDPPEGWYIYDLNSTHGTFLNKQRIPPKVFIRIRVGHMLRLGSSTRSYILQGPQNDEEPESELSVTEMREQHEQKVAEAEAEAVRKAAQAEERERNEGISWGMGEDADEETDLTHNPFASTNNEELFLDDPKKTLRGYFEREGVELIYKCDEMSVGSFVCRIDLPIDDTFGRPIVAEVVHKGRKKECVVQCALEACRILDRHGVLRQANQEPLKRKVKAQSDSDDDDFLDRTGDVERKKLRKSNPSTKSALTYEDLLKQESDLSSQLQQVEENIKHYQETQRRLKTSQISNMEDLDDFMQNLTSDVSQLDKTEIRKLRLEQQRLTTEKQKVLRLIKIVRPIDLHFEKLVESSKRDQTTRRQLPMIGKRNQFSKFKIAKIVTHNETEGNVKQHNLASDEEEFDEDDTNITSTSREAIQNTTSTESAITSEVCQKEDTTFKKDLSEVPAPSLNNAKKIYGPAIIQPGNGVGNEQEKRTEISTNQPSPKLQIEAMESDGRTETEDSIKKRRQRQRQRQKRQGIDLDGLEEHESSEKYEKWVPPPNQSGDGFTELNEKYGY